MSADNWTQCPVCVKRYAAQAAKRIEAAQDMYGKATAAAFIAATEAAERFASSGIDNSMREDYDIGMDDSGVFSVDYRCSCDCGFRGSYKHSESAQ